MHPVRVSLFNVQGFYEPTIFGVVSFHDLAQLLGCARRDLRAIARERFDDARLVERAENRGPDPLDDRTRRTARGRDCKPDREIVAGNGFRDRRHIWQHGRASGACHRERLDALLLQGRRHGGDCAERNIDVTAQQGDIDVARTAVRDHTYVKVRRSFEQLGGKMRRPTHATRCVGELARLAFCESDEIGDRGNGYLWAGDDEKGAAGDESHRSEILERFIGRIPTDERRDDEGAIGRQQDRVAIRLRLGDHVRPDASIGAGPVLYEYRLSQVALYGRCELAGDDVGGAARCEGHNDTDRSRWEICDRLGAGSISCDQQATKDSREATNEEFSGPLLPTPYHKHVPHYCFAQVKLAASLGSPRPS